MTATVLGLLGVAIGLALRALVSAVVVGEIKGLWKDHLSGLARKAAKELPGEIADDTLAEWLEELATLEDRPLRAWHFVRGLSTAAVSIAAKERSTKATRRHRLSGFLKPRASVARFLLAAGGVTYAARLSPSIVPLLFLGSAVLYATRVVVHTRLGYWAASSTVASSHGRRLRGLMIVETALATGWVGGALVLLAFPDPLVELFVALPLLVLVALLAGQTVSEANELGMPRGTDVIHHCRVIQVMQLSALRVDSEPVRFLARALEARTPVRQVSPLIRALLLALTLMTVVAGLSLLVTSILK
jgi:hypothetical protein